MPFKRLAVCAGSSKDADAIRFDPPMTGVPSSFANILADPAGTTVAHCDRLNQVAQINGFDKLVG